MLSQSTIDIVKSTAPILEKSAEILTQHFYKRMFSHNPEVIPFFNHSNQKDNTQQKALAAAITGYAANIDNLDVLGGAVELIANKHASLQIKPEQYPIVGENLLASIKEVLGESATDEVIQAWAEAYEFLADILIGREQQIYEVNKKKSGGWEGFRKFKVERKERESSIITSFYLKPEQGGEVPIYSAGQYITLRIPTIDGSTTMRNYSLSDKPGQGHFRISVKREISPDPHSPSGYVSNKLHDEIQVGDILEVGSACGEFFLNTHDKHERPLVLLAAGIGITPIISILLTALETMPNRQIIFIHACLNKEVQAFKDVVDLLAQNHPNLTVHYCYNNLAKEDEVSEENVSAGLVTPELIDSLIPSRNSDYYFCGPKPFMMNIYFELLKWGIPGSQVHFEFFGPKQELKEPSISKPE